MIENGGLDRIGLDIEACGLHLNLILKFTSLMFEYAVVCFDF